MLGGLDSVKNTIRIGVSLGHLATVVAGRLLEKNQARVLEITIRPLY